MIRPVLALAVSTALLGVALPAIDAGGTAHSEARVADELDRLESAARTLALRSEPAPRGAPARRTLTLRLPERRWAHPGVARLSIPGPDGRRVTWQVGTGATHSREFDGPLVGPPGGLTIREGGRHDLVLLRREGRVVVRRLEFITGDGSTGTHGPSHVAVGDGSPRPTLRL